MKKTKKWYIILLILLLFIIGGVYFFFINNNINDDEGGKQDNQENSEERVKSKTINFGINLNGYLEIVLDVTLTEALKSDEVLTAEIDAFDKENKLLYSFLATSRMFDINNLKEIHLGFDYPLDYDFSKIDYLNYDIKIVERTTDSSESYDYIELNNPEVVQYKSLYRIFIDLEEYYLEKSGLTTVEYDDIGTEIKRISFLSNNEFIGVTLDYDYSIDQKINKVCVYRIGEMWERKE